MKCEVVTDPVSCRLIIASESYGGHYIPEFITYFDEQNTKISQGTLQGEKIEICAIMINKWVVFDLNLHVRSSGFSGWFDPLLANKAYVDFATNAPGYGRLQNDTVISELNKAFYGKNGCKEQEEACYAARFSVASNDICATADNYCVCLPNDYSDR